MLCQCMNTDLILITIAMRSNITTWHHQSQLDGTVDKADRQCSYTITHSSHSLSSAVDVLTT